MSFLNEERFRVSKANKKAMKLLGESFRVINGTQLDLTRSLWVVLVECGQEIWCSETEKWIPFKDNDHFNKTLAYMIGIKNA